MRRYLTIVAAALLFVDGAAHATPVIEQTVGEWTIRSDTDGMTAAKVCFATYRESFDVQLGTRSFSVNYGSRGGVRSFTIRYDSSPALPLSLPDELEQRIGAVILEGPQLYALLSSQRFRIQTLTQTGSLLVDDVNLTDIRQVGAAILACEGDAPLAQSPSIVRGQNVGAWTIYTDTDPMNDQKDCFAVHSTSNLIQLHDDFLLFRYTTKGGVQSFHIRFDDEEPMSISRPTQSDRQASLVVIRARAFRRLFTSQRLRLEVLTEANRVSIEDLDISDLPMVRAAITTCQAQ